MRLPLFLAGLLVLSGCALDADDTEEVEGGEVTSEIAATNKKTIEYFVQAHPDDEIGAWSLIQRSTTRYPVLVLLTRGEETSYCTSSGAAGNERAFGEAAPPGDAYRGKWSSGCREARVQSWHRFLDAMADYDASLSKPPFRGRYVASGSAGVSMPSRVDADGRVVESRAFEVWADEKSARVVFDLGDNDLTPDEVTWAVQAVRARRRALFPRIAEGSVVASSYRNVDPRCDFYDHHDHRSVHVAIFGTNQGTPGPQLGRTCIHDPDVANGGRIVDVDADIFEKAMAVDAPAIDPERYPNARRVGAFQIHYGWLMENYWPVTRGAGEGLISQRQAFWSRF